MSLFRIVFAVLAFGATALACARIARPKPTTQELVDRVTARGIKVTFDVPELHDLDGWPVEWDRLPAIYQDRWLPVVEREVARYPEGFFARIQLGTLLLCRDVRTNGRASGGLAVAGRHAILVGLDRHRTEDFVRRTVHHEIFHVLDHRYRETLDPEWDALNAGDFPGYLGSGWHALGVAGYGGALSESRGFLTDYAKASQWEDRAELFSWSVVHPEVVQARAARDPIVRRKLALVAKRCERSGLPASAWKRSP